MSAIQNEITDKRYSEARRVTLVGAVIDLVLGLAKIAGSVETQSQALLADGVHSLSDLGTDALVLFAARQASQDPDEAHPYGHQRFETATTVLIGLTLIAVGLGIGIDAVSRLFHPDRLWIPSIWAVAFAAVSVIAKEAVYHYTMFAAKRLNSKMLRANAWHSRSDAISSIIVIVGVLGTIAGLPYLDALAAVVVAWMIGQMGWSFGWSSMSELVDTGLASPELASIKKAILSVEGVKSLHQLRTRHMGSHVVADVHIIVDPYLSVSEGHHIGDQVYAYLKKEMRDVRDLTVHIDPEDDEDCGASLDLPSRPEVLEQLETAWKDILPPDKIDNITLHYVNDQIHVEVWLSLNAVGSLTDTRRIADALSQALKAHDAVGNLEVLFRWRNDSYIARQRRAPAGRGTRTPSVEIRHPRVR